MVALADSYSNLCFFPSTVAVLSQNDYSVTLFVCLFSEKDWEDIRKMPEHGTLQKDFRKAKYEL